ncbi:hypothetical protein STEG23_003947 [Scotinomys teguina]
MRPAAPERWGSSSRLAALRTSPQRPAGLCARVPRARAKDDGQDLVHVRKGFISDKVDLECHRKAIAEAAAIVIHLLLVSFSVVINVYPSKIYLKIRGQNKLL